jgi:hypothetical protein
MHFIKKELPLFIRSTHGRACGNSFLMVLHVSGQLPAPASLKDENSKRIDREIQRHRTLV